MSKEKNKKIKKKIAVNRATSSIDDNTRAREEKSKE
jgi:hypothetical protein